jgi:hypothetical protein
MLNPDIIASLANIATEVLLDEITRRAKESGMTADDLIAATRDSIERGRMENEAGSKLGHEGEGVLTGPVGEDQ